VRDVQRPEPFRLWDVQREWIAVHDRQPPGLGPGISVLYGLSRCRHGGLPQVLQRRGLWDVSALTRTQFFLEEEGRRSENKLVHLLGRTHMKQVSLRREHGLSECTTPRLVTDKGRCRMRAQRRASTPRKQDKTTSNANKAACVVVPAICRGDSRRRVHPTNEKRFPRSYGTGRKKEIFQPPAESLHLNNISPVEGDGAEIPGTLNTLYVFVQIHRDRPNKTPPPSLPRQDHAKILWKDGTGHTRKVHGVRPTAKMLVGFFAVVCLEPSPTLAVERSAPISLVRVPHAKSCHVPPRRFPVNFSGQR